MANCILSHCSLLRSGALQCVGKAERKRDPNDLGYMPHIYTRVSRIARAVS